MTNHNAIAVGSAFAAPHPRSKADLGCGREPKNFVLHRRPNPAEVRAVIRATRIQANLQSVPKTLDPSAQALAKNHARVHLLLSAVAFVVVAGEVFLMGAFWWRGAAAVVVACVFVAGLAVAVAWAAGLGGLRAQKGC